MRLARLRARPLDAPMSEPFETATARRAMVRNVLVEARLADGTRGWGECAPMPGFGAETQASALAACRRALPALEGMDAGRPLAISEALRGLLPGRPAVAAGVEMAVLDAWARRRRVPLWVWFGGASDSVRTDVTVPIMPPGPAFLAARRILRSGVSTVKVKVGKDLDGDVLRVAAVHRAAPAASLIVDANQGYDSSGALRLLRLLARRGIRPALFEQPVPAGDWDGMARVGREGGVPVAADETASSVEDILRVVRCRCASVVNIKLMKLGLFRAVEAARLAAAAGLRLMMGGMVETRLAMTAAAHLAAGLGGFEFVDLDTPLWISRDPMTGLRMGRGGLYPLGLVRAGIGVRPRRPRPVSA